MALNIVTGSVAMPGSTGNFDITLAANTDPVAIIIVASPNAANGAVTHASMSIGYGTYRGSAVQQTYRSIFSEDAAANSDTYRRGNTDAVCVLMDATGAIDLEVDLVSMTTGSGSKVTLNAVNLHTTASVRLFYTVFGGSDVTDAEAHSSAPTAGTGAHDVTLGSGFGHPSVVFFDTGLQPIDASSHGDLNVAFGWGVLAGATLGASYSSIDASATMTTSQAIYSAKMQGFNGTTVEQDWVLAAESGWPTDGYEITKNTWTWTGDGFHGLALKFSGDVTVTTGQTTARTTTGDTDLAVGSSTPKGLVLAHVRTATDATIDSTSTDAALFGIGMVDGSGNERWIGLADDDGSANSVTSSNQTDSKAIQLYLPSSEALDAEADGTVSGSNFRLSWTDAAPSAFLYNYIAFGVTTAATPDRIQQPIVVPNVAVMRSSTW